MRALSRIVVFAALSTVLALSTPRSDARAEEPAVAAVSTLVGAGSFGDKVMCLGCGAAIVGAGGMLWGGILVVSFFHADAVLACGYICYGAFVE